MNTHTVLPKLGLTPTLMTKWKLFIMFLYGHWRSKIWWFWNILSVDLWEIWASMYKVYRPKTLHLANYILIFVFKHQSISGLILQALNLHEKINGKEKNVRHERDLNLGPWDPQMTALPTELFWQPNWGAKIFGKLTQYAVLQKMF